MSPVVGEAVWSTSRQSQDQQPLGGVILNVTEQLDESTGEIREVLLCMDPYRTREPAFHTLTAAEVSEFIDKPDPMRNGHVVRTLASQLTQGKGKLSQREEQFVSWMKAVVVGTHR